MSKRITVFLSLLLIAALLLAPAAALAEGEDENVIHIRTADDLLELAKSCSLDTWSDGKKVVLDNDLSLSDAAFHSTSTPAG